MSSDLPISWHGLFDADYTRQQFGALMRAIAKEYVEGSVFPPPADIFHALELTRPNETKVVLVGQDPYHTPGKAHGLSFSVRRGIRPPRSLLTIFRELERSVPTWSRSNDGNLEGWASQGVLLLNRILTVRQGAPLSHAGLGWEQFTAAVLRHVQRQATFVVFLLWGKAAQQLETMIDRRQHAVLTAIHPSPTAQINAPPEGKFVGCGHFVEANRLLVAHDRLPVNWCSISNDSSLPGDRVRS